MKAFVFPGQGAAFQSLYPQILKLAYNVLMTFHSAMNIHMGVDGLHPSLRLSYYFIST
jgi:malonyl CoA-acyl carrier protein transacylase